MTGPAEFVDAEVIKQKLESIEAKLDEIIGRLEAIEATLGEAEKEDIAVGGQTSLSTREDDVIV